MTYRVHASMDHVEPRSPHAVVNRSRAEPETAQLLPRDNTMLAARQRESM